MSKVILKREKLSIPTYGVGTPDKNPMFFEKRVYQGSSGKVYPIPFIDKVFDSPEPREYDSVRVENRFVRLVMLPEIGGRIFLGRDKTNDDYDFFYYQDVIKPALVGLAGPWISGGVEFNWPQHHRPSTFMPVDVHLEKGTDGSGTVWMSEHDPLNRIKGMHGICVHPESSLVELKVRIYNRTPFTQTFLWWANVAAEVHDNYQSFFPPDVRYVADHAVRALSSFPLAENDYYGIDYAARPEANDLTWHKNIPVPTSYMVCSTQFDFFGGYDYDAAGGFIHVADRHIAPGKKQWTWGNDEFGWAWDRELADRKGPTGRPAPYVELMAGVYTDNQPDFTYLLPCETKTFSQYWWPYKKIGPVQNANRDVAVRLVRNEGGTLDLGAVASRRIEGVRIVLCAGESVLMDETVTLSPEQPWHRPAFKCEAFDFQTLNFSLEGYISYRPPKEAELPPRREVATEPPLPAAIDSIDELFLTAEHLEQYRHPTRYPEIYWHEILLRDPLDVRTNIAYGRWKLNRGLLDEAARHFEVAIKRLTCRHPNPYTGEAHYYLGIVRRFQGLENDAYTAFYKATWNYEWRAAAYYELALIDCRRKNFSRSVEHCEASLETSRWNNKAQVLKAVALRKLGRDSRQCLEKLLKTDPLDHWARLESGDIEDFLVKSRNNAQSILDIAYDYADAGCIEEAVQLLELHHANNVAEVAVPDPSSKSVLTHYALAWLKRDSQTLQNARSQAPHYLFPSRLHDQLVLEWAVRQSGEDRNAAFGLGNYFYDRKRFEDAIHHWEQAHRADPAFATVCRNLGIAYWNVLQDGDAARAAYRKAMRNDPEDSRLLYEYDQLRKKLGDPVTDRLAALEKRRNLVEARDDCTVEFAALCNQTSSPEDALKMLLNRRFHPWEGGEGEVLRQYRTARLLLGQRMLEQDAAAALEQFTLALKVPANLGEAYHPLQARADIHYWQGRALRKLGREDEAVACFEAGTDESGDFLSMAVTEYSDVSCYRGLSLMELGRFDEARSLFEKIRAFAEDQMAKDAEIDYFATSLPKMLVFEEDIEQAKNRQADYLLRLVKKSFNIPLSTCLQFLF